MQGSGRLSFGLYEVDLENEELLRAGQKVRVQSQPFQVLALLLERPGTLVTREELRQRIWGEDTNVDFDQALSTAVTKVRDALRDSADNPKFVQTVPRKGYRFLAPVQVLQPESPPAETPLPEDKPYGNSVEAGSGTLTTPLRVSASASPNVPVWRGLALISSPIFLCVVLLGLFLPHRSAPANLYQVRQLTFDGRLFVPGIGHDTGHGSTYSGGSVSDGSHVFSPADHNGHGVLIETPVAGGDETVLPLPPEILSPDISDISSDHSRLLVLSKDSNGVEGSLWIVSLANFSAQRVQNVAAHAATWMPNGADILFASGDALRIVHPQNATVEPFATLPSSAFWLRWSPDGQLLRFTMMDRVDAKGSLWELSPTGKSLRRVLRSEDGLMNPCCGVWASSGRYIFASDGAASSNMWELDGDSQSRQPFPLTSGPLNYGGPAADPTGKQVYVTGVAARPLVQIFDQQLKLFRASPRFLFGAWELQFSNDQQWITWVDRFGKLWRARADGRDMLQLTPEDFYVYMARWSPDGSHIAVMAREPNHLWQIYLLGMDGGEIKPLTHESYDVADPTWSPDGKTLAFGRSLDRFGQSDAPFVIHLLELQTGQISSLPPGPGSVFSPRWSPDGGYILALSSDQTRIYLFNTRTQTWSQLGASFYSNPTWSQDGRSVFVQVSGTLNTIVRISVPDGHTGPVCDQRNMVSSDATSISFIGLAPEDKPVVRNSLTGDLFSIRLPERK